MADDRQAPFSKTPLSPGLQRKARFAAWLQRRVPAAYKAWTLAGVRKWRQRDTPWAPIAKPLDRFRVALISSGGFVLPTQEPFDLNDLSGDCSYRIIDNNADPSTLRVSHAFYDTDAASTDSDVLFPLRALRALVEAGKIGAAAAQHASFSGSIPDPTELVSDYAPEVAEIFSRDEVDLVLLTPA
jgi:D-proline reductase (dithiol) PrdB